jgi:hypothetical protein
MAEQSDNEPTLVESAAYGKACRKDSASLNAPKAMHSLNAIATISSGAWKDLVAALGPDPGSRRDPQPATNQRVQFKRGRL